MAPELAAARGVSRRCWRAAVGRRGTPPWFIEGLAEFTARRAVPRCSSKAAVRRAMRLSRNGTSPASSPGSSASGCCRRRTATRCRNTASTAASRPAHSNTSRDRNVAGRQDRARARHARTLGRASGVRRDRLCSSSATSREGRRSWPTSNALRRTSAASGSPGFSTRHSIPQACSITASEAFASEHRRRRRDHRPP